MPFDLAIVIPSYYEKGLFDTLSSLNRSANAFPGRILVVIVINQSDSSPTEIDLFHKRQFEDLLEKRDEYSFRIDLIFEKDIPEKKAGVGFARKLGMDRAYKLLTGGEHPIINLDADCRVREDYCSAWYDLFRNHTVDAATMHFEHRLDNLNPKMADAIIQYELHLHYYFLAQKHIHYPNAIQAVGSCMGVRKDFYNKIGGMNTRKAGEDFYFLQKCILNGKYVYCKNSTVYPEARISDRVPFGTGKAMKDLISSEMPYRTYSFKSFMTIGKFLHFLETFVKDQEMNWGIIPEPMHPYLKKEELEYNLNESVKHSSSPKALRRRLFRWFTPFRMMKALHHLRDTKYPDVEVSTVVDEFLSKKGVYGLKTPTEQLRHLRKIT